MDKKEMERRFSCYIHGDCWKSLGSSDVQVVKLGNKYPSESRHRRLERRGYGITSMATTDDQAAFILSIPAKKMVDETRETLCTYSFPTDHIKERWSRNVYITSICSGRPFADFQL